MTRLGCLLMIVAVSALCVLTILPVLPFTADTAAIDDLLTGVLCQPNERLQREQYSYPAQDGGIMFSMNVACVDREGRGRDINDLWTIVSMISFCLPFGAGVLLIITGLTRRAGQVVTVAQTAVTVPVPAAAQGKSLADRLRELQQAHEAGLLTDTEYERLRREILDSTRD